MSEDVKVIKLVSQIIRNRRVQVTQLEEEIKELCLLRDELFLPAIQNADETERQYLQQLWEG